MINNTAFYCLWLANDFHPMARATNMVVDVLPLAVISYLDCKSWVDHNFFDENLAMLVHLCNKSICDCHFSDRYTLLARETDDAFSMRYISELSYFCRCDEVTADFPFHRNFLNLHLCRMVLMVIPRHKRPLYPESGD